MRLISAGSLVRAQSGPRSNQLSYMKIWDPFFGPAKDDIGPFIEDAANSGSLLRVVLTVIALVMIFLLPLIALAIGLYLGSPK